MKNLILVLIALLPSRVFAQAKGALLNDSLYETAPTLSPALRFSDNAVPEVYSLKKYCPTAGDQNPMGSCVAWSTGYAALTISWAVKYNVTSKLEINKHAKSALFIYNQLKGPDDPKEPCGRGLDATEAVEWIRRNGDCDFDQFPVRNCKDQPSPTIINKASEFPVDEAMTLFRPYSNGGSKINAVIYSLSENKPVVGVFIWYPSFEAAGKTGVWQPRPDVEKADGAHAMCIVGYDNKNRQFEILNSWGTNYGNQGYIKISYDDFAKICRYGYAFKLGYTKEELARMVTLTGDFAFRKFLRVNDKTSQNEFAHMYTELSGDHYIFNNGNVKKDDFYRLTISNVQKDSYLYIFSLKPDHTCEVLFPISASDNPSKINDVALIPSSGASVELPEDDSRAYSTDIAGDDMMCLLYSTHPIPDIKNITKTINNMPGEMSDRLQKLFGSRLVPSSKISYDRRAMSFSATTDKGNIVPIILKVAVSN